MDCRSIYCHDLMIRGGREIIMNIGNYIVKSLELHLFFGRIMKEHALFL